MQIPFPNPGSTRSSVLAAIRDPANRSAWERFFDQYAPYLYALAIRRGLRHADAEDVVQTVLVEVAAKIPSFSYDRAKGRFHSWLAASARYRIDDLLRRNARRDARETLVPGLSDHTPFPVPAAPDAFSAAAEEEWTALVRRRALERLRQTVSPRQFELFHASVVEGWPAGKVMRVFSVSRAALYQTRHRVLPLFQAALLAVQDELDAPPSLPSRESPPPKESR